MKKNFYSATVSICCFALLFSSGFSHAHAYPPKESSFKKYFLKAEQALTGKGDKGKQLLQTDKDALRNEVSKFVQTEDFKSKTKGFPLVPMFFQAYLVGSNPTPICDSLCTVLTAIDREIKRLNNGKIVNPADKLATYAQYNKTFSLNIEDKLKWFFRHNTCDLKKETCCDGCTKTSPPIPKDTTLFPKGTTSSDPKDSIIEKLQPPQPYVITTETGMEYTIYPDGKTAIKAPNGKFTSGNHPAEAAVRAAANGVLNTDDLEILTLLPGRLDTIVPRDKHKFSIFEVMLKSSVAKDTFRFPPAMYSFSENGQPTEMFQKFSKGIRDVATFLDVLAYEFGKEVFEVVIVGGADLPGNFKKPKPLKTLFDKKHFAKIPVTTHQMLQDSIQYKNVLLEIGDTYHNDELPDLRAAFTKMALTECPQLKDYEDRFRIVKGQVTNRTNAADRNCTILIYIDRRVIEKRLKPEPSFSPFKIAIP